MKPRNETSLGQCGVVAMLGPRRPLFPSPCQLAILAHRVVAKPARHVAQPLPRLTIICFRPREDWRPLPILQRFATVWTGALFRGTPVPADRNIRIAL